MGDVDRAVRRSPFTVRGSPFLGSSQKKAIVGKSKRQREIRNLTTLVLGFAFTNRAEKIVEGIAVTSAT
jgi:hypothetical protein